MIIFNTTYCIDSTIHDECLMWLKEELIPIAIHSGEVYLSTLARIYSQEDGDNGVNYSLQFKVENVDVLQEWFETTGDMLHSALTRRFGEQVLTFTTLMEEVEL
ncbi:MAG: DUF4286 family protein [Bacteroidales bacterium]